MCVPVSRYSNTLLFGHLIVTVGSTVQNIPLTSLWHHPFLPGEGRGAQAEFCPAGDDGQPGPAAQPRACGMYDLLRGPAAWRRGHTEGVSPLLLQVENEYYENQRNERSSRKVVGKENKK